MSHRRRKKNKQTSLYSNASVVHVTTNVGEDLGLQAELADGYAVQTRLL